MKFFKSSVIALFVSIASCTLDKTDFDAEMDRDVTEFVEFEEVMSFKSDPYKISIEALNGTFYKGYNEVRLKIVET